MSGTELIPAERAFPSGCRRAILPAVEIDFSRMRRERRSRLARSLRDTGADGLVLLSPSNQEYAGFRRPCTDAMRVYYEPAVAVLTADADLHIWTPFPDGVPEEIPADRVHRELDVEFPEGAAALITELTRLLGATPRVAIDEFPGGLVEISSDASGPIEWTDGALVTGPARFRKTADEVACLREAQRINEVAILDVQKALRPGVRQNELTAVLFRRAFELGATASCVDPIWNLTPRDRAHQTPTVNGEVGFPIASNDRFLREGDLILCDTGLVWEGYHSDFGATWLCADDPRPDAGLRECYRRWRDVMACVYESVRPGRSAADVTRDVIAIEPDYRLDHFYLAHGVGCDAAEAPFLGTDRPLEADEEIVLEPGTTMVFEPVIWKDGIGGYRSEELVVVTETGCERLSAHGYAPFED